MLNGGKMRRQLVSGVVQGLVALTLVVLALGTPAPRPMRAEADWEQTGLAEKTTLLFTPASGAFYAGRYDLNDGRNAFWLSMFKRSDDAGDTWHDVSVLPETSLLTVDPTDHQIIFAIAGSSLYKSTDGGDSWTTIKSENLKALGSGNSPSNMAVSPADHQL